MCVLNCSFIRSIIHSLKQEDICKNLCQKGFDVILTLTCSTHSYPLKAGTESQEEDVSLVLSSYSSKNMAKLYTWKATIPFFFKRPDQFFWSLPLWSSAATCVRVAVAFYVLFLTKCRKNTALLRVGLQCSFDLTILVYTVQVKQYFTKIT